MAKKRQLTALGKYIKDSLGKIGKTQAWLAETIDVSDNAVSKWLYLGQISRENFLSLVKIFGIEGAPDMESVVPPQPPKHEISALTANMFAITCSKCGKISHHSFIELEANDAIPCAGCGINIVVSDYYGKTQLETILKNLGGSGLSLRKR